MGVGVAAKYFLVAKKEKPISLPPAMSTQWGAGCETIVRSKIMVPFLRQW